MPGTNKRRAGAKEGSQPGPSGSQSGSSVRDKSFDKSIENVQRPPDELERTGERE